MNYKTIISIKLLCMLMLFTTMGKAQDVEHHFQSRNAVSLQLKPIKNFKLWLSPEVRIGEDFSIDNYFLETGVQYKIHKMIRLGASHRYVINPRDEKETEKLHRFAFFLTFKKNIERFDISFRSAYTNFNDDLSSDKHVRFKLKAKYNIPKIPLFPYVSAEAYNQLAFGQFSKMRYQVGLEYKISKHHYIDLGYKLDYYLLQYTNKHILSLTYTYKL